jgi:hypothetical protein
LFCSFLTSVRDGSAWSTSSPGRFTPGKESPYRSIGGQARPTARLHGFGPRRTSCFAGIEGREDAEMKMKKEKEMMMMMKRKKMMMKKKKEWLKKGIKQEKCTVVCFSVLQRCIFLTATFP